MNNSQSFVSPTPSPSNSPRSNTMLYLELSAMICICIVVTLLFFLLHKNRNRQRDRLRIREREGSDSDPETRERQGIAQEALEQLLPLTNYGHQLDKSENSSYCVICLESFTDGEPCRVFPVCNHIFHSSCIDAWLKDHLTCPVCRISCKANV
ncbi:E3 ubiquitin-protein ligase ATL76-like [Pistacia vera]|uniref:E3 ubiquitin-protein ligase ATL76-like n=1 Tax=Pistacia vera TaxID=55513 RepID=UPI0012638736|nr:E3 ubiquitin-protein ligase ATL76-like [Pistacia vera]XP_031284123.1 E3 ubiquitin-protein ligase ATL76-like [Pistacia vera]